MKLAAFDLNLLKVLDALLIEASTTRAGARIGLSQPAVSAALGRLRVALDDPLFVRDGTALRPTEFAMSLREPIRTHLNGLERSLAGARSFDPATCDASFRISGSDFFSVMLLPALMTRLGELAPGLKVSFVDLIHPNNLHEMGRLNVDIALPCTHSIPPNIEAEAVFWSAWQVVARTAHPRLDALGLKDGDTLPMDLYCDMDHVVFSAEGQHASYEDQVLSTLGRSRRVQLSVGSFRDVYETVAGSDLLAVLPGTLARAAARRFDLQLHPVPFVIEPALLWLAWNRWHTEDLAHLWLRKQMTDLMQDFNDVNRPLPSARGEKFTTQAAE